MKRFFAYLAGGLACLGAGAGGFVAAETYYRPPAQTVLFAAHTTVSESIDELLPLVGKALDKTKLDSAVVPEESGAQSMLSDQSGSDSRLRGNDDKPATVFFAGDIMFDRAVEAKIVNKGSDYSFAKIKDTVSAANYAIANLEGPITTINNVPDNDLRFNFDPALGPELAAAGFDAFSLANNHGLDQGSAGFADTKKNLIAAGLGYFGDPVVGDGPVLRFTTGYVRFAVIGLNDLFRKIDPAVVAEQIKEAKKDSDYVIIYSHWGEEYKHDKNARQAELAHAFIDAGADLVIGSHPHVVQGIESYKGKMIFYSLGNLIFDQYFSVDTQQGLALRLNIDPQKNVSIDLLPYELPQSQPSFVNGDKKIRLLGQIASWSAPELKGGIEAGNIKF